MRRLCDSSDFFMTHLTDRIYTCHGQELGGFQTAGYIGPLMIYAADAAPGYTVFLPGHYNLGYIVPPPPPGPTIVALQGGWGWSAKMGVRDSIALDLDRESVK